MTSMRPVLVAALALAALAAPASAQGTVDRTILLHENPYHIAPDAIEVAEGSVLRLRVENVAGNAGDHNLVLDGYGVSTALLTPGSVAFLNVTLDIASPRAANGDLVGYSYYCSVPGHSDGGQIGTLRVVPLDSDGGGAGGKGIPAAGLVALLAAGAVVAALRRRA